MSQRIIAHLDMDAFFVEAERLHDPSLRGRPVVVGGDPDGRGVAAAASYEARRFGVHSAMPLKTVRRLCPQAVFVHHHGARYRAASDAVFDVLRSFVPVVQPVSIDEAYLDLTGTERLYGKADGAVRVLRGRIRAETDLPSSAGIGTSKLVTKIASGLAKPDGQRWVPPGSEAAFLAPLPIAAIPGVGRVGGRRLREGGVRTIGDLAARGKARLEAWLGDTGAWLWECSQGIDDRAVKPPGDPKSVGRETTFSEDRADADYLESTVHHLAGSAAARLRRCGMRARTVTVKFRTADFTTCTRAQTLDGETWLDAKLVPAALGLFRGLFHGEHAGAAKVRLIGVYFSGLSRGPAQMSLLAGEDEKKEERLARSVDAIRDKFGKEALVAGKAMRY
ncbi:MAG: DNA polymerase IV, partial [Myxococcota bacterium]